MCTSMASCSSSINYVQEEKKVEKNVSLPSTSWHICALPACQFMLQSFAKTNTAIYTVSVKTASNIEIFVYLVGLRCREMLFWSFLPIKGASTIDSFVYDCITVMGTSAIGFFIPPSTGVHDPSNCYVVSIKSRCTND